MVKMDIKTKINSTKLKLMTKKENIISISYVCVSNNGNKYYNFKKKLLHMLIIINYNC